MIKVNPEFRDLIPPLQKEELQALETSILSEGCRESIILWDGFIVDGHNRYEICTQHGLPFNTVDREFESENHVKLWMIDNQIARRNITDFTRGKLSLMKKPALAAIAKQNQIASGGDKKSADFVKSVLPNLAKPINTREELAADANISHGSLNSIERVIASEDVELIALADQGVVSISAASKIAKLEPEKREKVIAKVDAGEKAVDAIREVNREETINQLESIEAKNAKALEGVFDVVVIDPPWPMEKIERDVRPNQSEFDYPTMSELELSQMEIPAAADCHVWLWTTHKFLPMAYRLLDVWGLKYVCNFVWHKPGGFQPIGLPQYNCEFALYARKGSPKFIDTKAFPTCFNAPRGKHSEKPEEFYDVVRRVTAGRRADIFNRRQIDGFEGWGNEA